MPLNRFQCGGRLFKVPYWHLKKYSPVLLRLDEPDTDGTRGTSNDTAIPIDDFVSAEEFVIFLDFFYRGFVPIHHGQWFCLTYILLKYPSPRDPDRRMVQATRHILETGLQRSAYESSR
jgi:hypothetical protein